MSVSTDYTGDILFEESLRIIRKKNSLKVLSGEMDPAEIRLIRKVVIKERGSTVS